MLFENNDYINMIINNSSVDSDYEGFLKGNMFPKEYLPYKNYTYLKPEINSKEEKLLSQIMEYAFIINDYNLYLDLHPEDKDMLSKYKTAVKKCAELKSEYTHLYGPLCINDADYNEFKWITSPWPWDPKDGKYV